MGMLGDSPNPNLLGPQGLLDSVPVRINGAVDVTESAFVVLTGKNFSSYMGPHEGQQGVQAFERTDAEKMGFIWSHRSVSSHGWCLVSQPLLW